MLRGDEIFLSWLPGFLGGDFVISPAKMPQKLILACFVVMNVLAWVPKFLEMEFLQFSCQNATETHSLACFVVMNVVVGRNQIA